MKTTIQESNPLVVIGFHQGMVIVFGNALFNQRFLSTEWGLAGKRKTQRKSENQNHSYEEESFKRRTSLRISAIRVTGLLEMYVDMMDNLFFISIKGELRALR